MKKLFILLILIGFCCGCSTVLDPNGYIDEEKDYTVEDALVERPMFVGQDIAIADLRFFVPNDFVNNTYNGTYNIYEYYTGYATGSGPNGVDIIARYCNVDDSFDIEEWVVKDSTAKKKGCHITREKKNGHYWYLGNVNDTYYYYATYSNKLYEVSISKKSDPTLEYDTARDMLEKSLYIQKIK